VLTASLKFFMHPDLDDFRKSELVTRFRKVVVDKPKESRKGKSLRSVLGDMLMEQNPVKRTLYA